jgi:seryl-tRNA synthetase
MKDNKEVDDKTRLQELYEERNIVDNQIGDSDEDEASDLFEYLDEICDEIDEIERRISKQ